MAFSLKKIGHLIHNTSISRQDLLKEQDQKLRRMLHHAYQHSPYYANSFREAGISEKDLDTLPLSAFPTMTKAELIANYDQIVTVPGVTQELLRQYDEHPEKVSLPKGSHIVHSSGSTAKPTFFFYDDEAWGWIVAAGIRMAVMSLSLKEVIKGLMHENRILYAAITTGSFGGAVLIQTIAKVLHAKIRKLDVNEPKANWINIVSEYNPTILVGYPSSLQLLAEIIQKEKMTISPSLVVSSGEPLSPAQRSILTSTLNGDITNLYACSESLMLGVENYQGFFLFDDLNIIEVENGQMYITSLYNLAQPLIRYHISDSLELLPHEPGKYPFTQCRISSGREEDIIWFSEGQGGKTDFLHPLLFEDFCMPGLRDYQLRQTTPSHFDFVFCGDDNADITGIQKMFVREIAAILENHKLDFVTFNVRRVDSIPPDPRTGKKKLAVTLPRESVGV